MEHFAGTLYATPLTYKNGSGPISLIIKGKHTRFPLEILRLGNNSPPSMDKGEEAKMWDPATFLSARNTQNSEKHQPLQKELGKQQLVGEEQIQRGEPTHISAKESSTCCPYSKRTREGG